MLNHDFFCAWKCDKNYVKVEKLSPAVLFQYSLGKD